MPITVVTGPPGAGKTSVAAALARSRALGVHLVADTFFHWVVSGLIPPWLPESNVQNATVIEAIGAAAGRYAAGGYSVVADGIIGPWFLGSFLAASGQKAADLAYVVLRPSRSVALERAVMRSAGELTDPGPITAMYNVFEELGHFEGNVIDTSDEDVAATVVAVQTGLGVGAFRLREVHQEDMKRLARRYHPA